MRKSGIPVVISAPSGAGKSTIAARLVQKLPSTSLSISCTTRAPRGEERDGQDYFFTSETEFKTKIDNGDFVEWAEVHGYRYGTPRGPLERSLAEKRDVVLTIDPQGALAVKRLYPQGIFIFVIPPSWDVLVDRLTRRATDNKSALDIRIANARKELSYISHYDYLVINDALDPAVETVSSIVIAEHTRLSRLDLNQIAILGPETGR
jgi:guanylate kinase